MCSANTLRFMELELCGARASASPAYQAHPNCPAATEILGSHRPFKLISCLRLEDTRSFASTKMAVPPPPGAMARGRVRPLVHLLHQWAAGDGVTAVVVPRWPCSPRETHKSLATRLFQNSGSFLGGFCFRNEIFCSLRPPSH